MSPIKLSALAMALVAPAAVGLITVAGPASAAATGYCLDSGGDSSAIRVPAYLFRDCSNSSTNLKWVIERGQIKNVTTGYCLDSGGDSSAIRVPAYLFRDCSNPSTNLKWVIEGGQIKNQ